MKRLDVALADLGLAPSRAKAQEMLAAGDVEILVDNSWKVETKPSRQVNAAAEGIRVRRSEVLKFVSRGGLKLEGALKACKIEPQDFRCVDVGASTGGFSDCLLKNGAKKILAVDVGHSQLHQTLREDGRVESLEGVHIRELKSHASFVDFAREPIDLIVSDLSFISTIQLLPRLAELLSAATRLLCLIKPQFELGASQLSKSGIVRDSSLFAGLKDKLERECAGLQLRPPIFCDSPIEGQDGNSEFFCYTQRKDFSPHRA